MHRNIWLSRIIFPLSSAWFWLGIWIPYYLLFTDYGGIGLIETVVILVTFSLEVPTGALTDLIGKKRTLQLAFLLVVVGNCIMAGATQYWHLLVSVVVLGVGSSFFSGTTDAFVYDSLLSEHVEQTFESIMASIQKILLIVMAAASALGGWLYTVNPTLPYWGVAVANTLCLLLSFWLVEPQIDSVTFSWKNYLQQTKSGFRELFAQKNDLQFVWKLLIIGAFVMFIYEFLDPALALQFGLTDVQLGYLYAIIPLVSAAGAYWYEKSNSKHSPKFWWRLLVIVIVGTSIITPLLGMMLGVASLLARNIFYPIVNTISSATVNRLVESKYRTTTLSTFNMIRALPYVLLVAVVGLMITQSNAAIVVLGLGLVAVVAYGAISLKFRL